MATDKQDIFHLHSRFAFGLDPKEYGHTGKLAGSIRALFHSSKKSDYLNRLEDPRERRADIATLKALLMGLKSRKATQELNVDWVKHMAKTKAVLRERMTIFWHDHFATRLDFPYLMQAQNNTLREHSIGSFRKMVHSIAKDPAMILYLNNQQNRKKAPNENFARELMELFTLGEGHYSEKDIKEAARAFTGWHLNARGYFEFDPGQHDSGEKEIFGQKGKFGGEDVINMILENPRCAYYITEKIYKEFVNPSPDPVIVKALSEDFFKTDYNIGKLLENIMTSSWFYAAENQGVMIKSPTQLLVQTMRFSGLEFKRDRLMLKVQKSMGQVLFFPPNVAGWPTGQGWIDSSTLLARVHFPMACLDNGNFDFAVKEDPEEAIPEKRFKKKYEVSWRSLNKAIDQDISFNELSQWLLRVPLSSEKTEQIAALAQSKSGMDLQKSAIALMSLPEFQLA